MADDHHPSLVGGEEVLQPGERVDVQVVGRLVEEHDRRVGHQRPRQGDAHLPSAGELPALAAVVGLVEAEALEHLVDLLLAGVVAAGKQLFLQLLHLVGQPGALFPLGQMGEAVSNLLLLVQQRPEARVSFLHLVIDRPLGHDDLALGEVDGGKPLGPRHVQMVWLDDAAQGFQQSGLPRAV